MLGFAAGHLVYGTVFRLRSRFKDAVCGILQEAPHKIMVGLAGFVVGAFEV